MAVCPKCKKTVVEKVKNCSSCGTDVSEISSQISKEKKEETKSNVGCFIFVILILCWVGYSLISCSRQTSQSSAGRGSEQEYNVNGATQMYISELHQKVLKGDPSAASELEYLERKSKEKGVSAEEIVKETMRKNFGYK